jgi:nucleoside-diphosphate-sugar epimerase
VGDGKQKRDFIDVFDVVDALYLSINKKVKNKILNIGSGKPKSILEMIKY